MNNRRLAAGAIILLILCSGGIFGVYTLKMNKPMELFIPFKLTELPAEARPAMIERWRSIAYSDEVLKAVANEPGIMEGLGVSSEDEAIAAIQERTLVDLYKDGVTMRTLAKGLRKEREFISLLSERLFYRTKDAYVARQKVSNERSPVPSQ